MNANLMMKTIEMTTNEAKQAGKIGSDKFKELRAYQEAYPTFTISIKAATKRKVEFKGLTYKYMRAYIVNHDDEDGKIMGQFLTLIAQDKKDKVEGSEHLEAAGYLDVREWFLSTFPEIKTTKQVHNDKVKEILNKAA